MAVPGLLVVWSAGTLRRDTYRLSANPFAFGREHADAGDDRISRRHADLRVVNSVAQVTDLGSRNGTFVGAGQLASGGTVTAWLPAVFRAGHTVGVIVNDIEPYEVDATAEPSSLAARRQVEAAARAEENLTIEGPLDLGVALAHRYAEIVGGEVVDFDPRVGGGLDRRLSGTRPRTVILRLAGHALEIRDLPAITTWLETDVRFVTLTRRGEKPLSMLDVRSLARLQRRVMEAVPPFDELPARVLEVVRAETPTTTTHATAVEIVLYAASRDDGADVLARLRTGVCAWREQHAYDIELKQLLEQPPPEDVLRGADLTAALFGPSPAHAIQGLPGLE